MKRFIVSILCVTVFCIGLGALVEKAGASFKSDEKALALIRQARIAIGGEQSIAEVRSMIIKGNTSVTVNIDGESRPGAAETEIAMQLPDKMSKMINFRHPARAVGEKVRGEKHDVIIMRHGAEGQMEGEKRVFVRKIDPGKGEIEKIVAEGTEGEFTTADGKKVIVRKRSGEDVEKVIVGGEGGKRVRLEETAHAARGGHRDNQLLRTTLSLLLTAPAGIDVSYTYAGEGNVDGTPCDIVNAEFGGSGVKLYISRTSSLPVMMSYQGHTPNVMFIRSKEPVAGEALKDKVMFNHKIHSPALSEVQVRFADYRSVNGVQLPYKWTTSVAGQTTEVFEVSGYEINPANIAEKFKDQKVFVRTKQGS